MMTTQGLRRREDFLTLAFNAVPEMLFLVAIGHGPTYRFLLANEAFLRSFGVTEADLVDKSIDEVGSTVRELVVSTRCDQAVRTQRTISFEEEVDLVHGRAMLSVTLTPVVHASGTVTCLLGLVRDITMRSQSERRQRAYLEVMRLLATATNQRELMPKVVDAIRRAALCDVGVFWDIDPDERRMFCAEVSYEEGLGPFAQRLRSIRYLPGADLPGLVWRSAEVYWVQDLTEEPSLLTKRQAIGQDMKGACAFPIKIGSEVVGVIELMLREEWEIDLDLAETLESIGSQIGLFVERRRTEQDLRKSETRKAAILDTALDCIIGVDRSGRIIDFNPAAEKAFGYTAEQACGMALTDLVENIQPVRESVEDVDTLVVGEGGVIVGRRSETKGYRADGTEFAVEIAMVPILLEEQHMFTAFLRDITERKAVETLKDNLLSTVSHELRTPLASLRGFAELMLNREFDDDKRREFLEIIQKESERLNGLINDLLDVQRMEAGHEEYQIEPHHLEELLEDVARLFDRQLGECTLRVDIDPEAPPVQIDRNRVRQVLINLLANAVKFSPHGGEIVMSMRANVGDVVVRVKDEGVGIPPEELPRLFEKFYRVDSVYTRKIGGTGLGLALVKRIIEAHGGRVWVDSIEGQGSTFSFSLPVAIREGMSRQVVPLQS